MTVHYVSYSSSHRRRLSGLASGSRRARGLASPCRGGQPSRAYFAPKLCIPCEPEGKPLSRSLLDVLDADNYSVIGYWIDLVNRVGLHNCFIRYCVRCGFYRFGFGEWRAEIQNSAGKELHVEPRVEGRTTAKFAGPRDHRRLIMGVAAILCAYGGNNDVQADL